MPVTKAEAGWEGTLKEGRGTMKLPSQGYEGPFTYASRFESGQGTNPEELIGAAQAGSFSMFLAAQLAKAGFPATRIHTTANVRIENLVINRIELTTEAEVPGISQELFDEKVQFSKENCPVSQALASVPEVTVNATLRQ